eukprot:TRINITY_DN56266_c0_g1_i1.p1 TRINITY_DN56266_c0_g1~~TRINITY_DN56266_c0_g1_i1.p1  ORF type:complete len:329 (+),score=44.83 TRINITY_DN56266_c0_g1_i1:105-989(+)
MEVIQTLVEHVWSAVTYVTPPERAFYPEPHPFRWMIAHPEVPMVAVFVYFLFVMIVPKLLPPLPPSAPKSRFRESLKRLEVLWNAGLALFSIIGLIRVVPRLLSNLRLFGLQYTVCAVALHSYGVGGSGLWVYLFIMSKFVELGDTVFLILQRRHSVRFLHWYHHITVLLYCWHSYVTKSGNGLWFATMNLFVHSLMYTYFALTGVGIRPRWNMALTVLQISQMFVGISITLAAIYYHYLHSLGLSAPCSVERSNIHAGLAMYFSYFLLFCHFFYERYLKSKPKRAVTDQKKTQ